MEKSPFGFLVSITPPFLSSRVPNLHLHGDANVDRVDEKRRADRRLDFLTELTFHKTIHKWCFSCGEKEGIDEAAEWWTGGGGGVHRIKSSFKSVSIHECMWNSIEKKMVRFGNGENKDNVKIWQNGGKKEKERKKQRWI